MDNKEIRRRNIEWLVTEYGGPTEFGKKIDRDQVQITQWRSKKPLGDRLARHIERKLGRPNGWIDQPQWPGSAEEQDASYGARLTVAKVIGTTSALKTFLKRRGLEYDPIEDAELFVAAYKEAEKLSEEPSQDETLAFASVVVDLIQEREARRGGQDNSGSVGGSSGGKDRKSRSG